MRIRSRRRTGAALATLIAAALVVSGCSATSGNGDETITVGQITTVSGGYPFGDTVDGTQSYINMLNENGGINGRQVRLVAGDDKGDAAEAAQLARKMVQQDGIVGMVGNTSIVDCQANRALYEGNDIAVIGGGTNADCFRQPNWMPVNAGPFTGIWVNWVYLHEEIQPAHVCYIGQNDPVTVPYYEQLAGVFEGEYGMKITTTYTNDATQDPTPAVTSAKSAGCDAVVMSTVASNYVAFINAAKTVGLDATFMCAGSCYDVGLAESLGANGEPGALGTKSKGVFVGAELTPVDDPGENIQEMLAQFEKDGVDSNFWSQIGWLSAKVFFDGLAQDESTDLTSQTAILDAMRAMGPVDTGFAATQLIFGEGDTHAPNLGSRMLQVVDGALVDAPGQDDGWTVIDPLPEPEK